MILKTRWFKWLPVIAWCFLIFYFTSSPLATGSSTAEIIAENTSLSHNGVEIVNVIFRKYAHLTAFGILAILFLRAMLPSRRTYLPAWAFATLYAFSDEWHQAFVPGRSASFRDVMLDSVGALIFLATYYVIKRHIAKTSNG